MTVAVGGVIAAHRPYPGTATESVLAVSILGRHSCRRADDQWNSGRIIANLLAAWEFKRFGIWAPFPMRYAFYLIWHILYRGLVYAQVLG